MQQVRGVISRRASRGRGGGGCYCTASARSTFTSELVFLCKGRLCGILLDCTTSGIRRGREEGSLIGSGGVRGSALVCSGMAAGATHHPQLIPL